MYSYIFDNETGGILLTPEHLKLSKEPRPVYYKELDLLGLDKYFNYEKNDEKPIMWAEMTNYIYKGIHIASTKGGNIYEAPKLIITEEGKNITEKLEFVNIDLMIKKNEKILEPFINETIKKVYNTYKKYQNKVDVFYVAFSGGKDSIVCLDIVKKALPYNDFKVLFGDTGMEFPDTYDIIDKVKKECDELGIEFHIAKSHLNPNDSWDIFGPPANDIRWCCSVHKSAPQINLLRKITDKNCFSGFAFIGARADESLKRSKYQYVSFGEKHTGQYNCYPILTWNSAEVYIYAYKNKLLINESYKLGNSRAGCLLCPFSSEHYDYIRINSYQNETKILLNKIEKQYRNKYSNEKLYAFIKNKGWKLRRSSRDIELKPNYFERIGRNETIIFIKNPSNEINEWIKTIGTYRKLNDYEYEIQSCAGKIKHILNVDKKDNSYTIKYKNESDIQFKGFNKSLKNILRKVAMCVGCGVCESNCEFGAISYVSGKIKINSDLCTHCLKCNNDIPSGCWVYDSLKEVKGEGKMSENKTLNRYNTHGPLMEWFYSFKECESIEMFLDKTQLGVKQKDNFIKFIKDCGIINSKKEPLRLYTFFNCFEITDLNIWGLFYINCCYNSEPIRWFINKFAFNYVYKKENIIKEIIYETEDASKDNRVPKDAVRDLIRIFKLPFSNIGLATVFSDEENDKDINIVRYNWNNPEPVIILYSLYMYAERCGEFDEKSNICSNLFSEFTLSRLYDDSIEQEGISPYKIFGIEKDELKTIINGLSIKYPDYISCSFTFDLDNINLNKEMRSENVLDLIK